MKQINLVAKDASKLKVERGDGMKSMVIGIVLLILSLALYGGMHFYFRSISAKTAIAEEEINNNKKFLNKDENKELYNFEVRLEEVGAQISSYSRKSDILEVLAKVTFPNTIFESLEIDKATADQWTISFIVSDYESLARQLKAFESMDGINEVTLISSQQKEEGLSSVAHLSLNLSK